MSQEIKTINNVDIAFLHSDEVLIYDVQTALDVLAEASYVGGCDCLVLNKEAFADEFFVLSSGLAGAVLQKFVQYRMKLAIVGDFSGYTSKPLQDFIRECNAGYGPYFVTNEDEAAERLTL